MQHATRVPKAGLLATLDQDLLQATKQELDIANKVGGCELLTLPLYMTPTCSVEGYTADRFPAMWIEVERTPQL